MNYLEILQIKWPDKVVIKVNGPNYEDLVWNTFDTSIKPTKAELDAAIADYDNTNTVQIISNGLVELSDTGVSAGMYDKVTVNKKGIVTGGSAMTASDVTTALGYTPYNATNPSGYITSSQALTNPGSITNIYSGTTSAITGTTQIPADTSIPLSTEGTQIWSQIVTPTSASARMLITQTFMVDCGTSNRTIAFALFRGTTCISTNAVNIATTSRPQSITIHEFDSPATTSAVTYSLRVGASGSSTWYLNQNASGSSTYGASGNSVWTILEVI